MQVATIYINPLKNALGKVFTVTRANDWRLSFVPFVMGGVYLWLWWFKFELSTSSAFIVFLSLITTVGFASLGYFINEFFDKESDALAGKINKLAYVPAYVQFCIFVFSLLLTLLPWVWLPANFFSWCLIALQISLFLVYSLPFPRLKEAPYASIIIDALYAYIVPLILSFYTFSLHAQQAVFPFWFLLFLIAVLFIGIRNIVIHQVKDLAKDVRLGHKTLPMLLGISRTNRLIFLLAAYEIFFFILCIVALSFFCTPILLFILPYIAVSFITLKVVTQPHYKISNDVLLINRVYQYLFPVFTIFILVIFKFAWIFLFFIHIALLVPWYLFVKVKEIVKIGYYKFVTFLTVDVRMIISSGINIPIYWAFKLFGVDLIKEQKSALEYLKNVLRRNI
jgi:4-hydroxybenzoate polyprenyltransferase